MLSSTSFGNDFQIAKRSVLELKSALRDFLDEESQQRQESHLQNISSAQVETNEKLASMEDQLSRIHTLLEQQAKIQADTLAAQELTASNNDNNNDNKDNNIEVKADEERIFEQIQRAAGCEGQAVPFRYKY